MWPNDTVFDFLPLPVDLIEQPSKFLHPRPLRLNPTRLSLRNLGGIVALLLEPFNLVPLALGRDSVSCNYKFDQIDDVGIRSRSEQEDVISRRTVRVVVFLGSDKTRRHERPKSLLLPPPSAK